MGLQNSSDEKYFKYFVRLQHLAYQLDGDFLSSHHSSLRYIQSQNPLKYLKYCPKVRSLKVLDDSGEGIFTKTPIELTRSLKLLESFTFLTVQWNENQTDLPFGLFNNLTSVSLCFGDLETEKLLTQIMRALSTLSNLQEIGLKIRRNVNSAFITACKEIAQRRLLKKINLHIYRELSSNLQKSLRAFKDCKLTSFSLRTFIGKTQALKSIFEFLQCMGHLEALELQISKFRLFSENDPIKEICQQMSKFQALRSLKLNFFTWAEVPKSTRAPDFIPFLSDLFTKPVKIEILRLECNQLDPSEALQNIISVLKNSENFLTHLTLNFGHSPCTQKAYKSVLKLMQSLSNIQVLKIPSLDFDGFSSKTLNSIVKAVYAFKYLRGFGFAAFKGDIAKQTLCRVVETISSKIGLRGFSLGVSYNFGNQGAIINMKGIIEKNPYFESLEFGNGMNNMNFICKIFKWE